MKVEHEVEYLMKINTHLQDLVTKCELQNSRNKIASQV